MLSNKSSSSSMSSRKRLNRPGNRRHTFKKRKFEVSKMRFVNSSNWRLIRPKQIHVNTLFTGNSVNGGFLIFLNLQ